jgi:L-threonylcarbamoyladenylate synthase
MPTRWLVSPGSPDEAVLHEVVARLRRGAVVAFPTDTLYGLGADPWNRAAIARIFALKGREAAQAIPLVAADRAQVEAAIGPLPPLGRALADAFWPGPLSLVVPAPPEVPRELLGGGSTVAVRVPAHAVARALAARLGRPLTATSANRSQAPPARDADEAERALGADLDGIVDAGPAPGGPPSTLVDVTGEAPRLVRAGAVPWERVVQFLAS